VPSGDLSRKELNRPDSTVEAMKNNVTQRKGFSSCVNGLFRIHLISVIKYNTAIDASVPAILNVLHINNR